VGFILCLWLIEILVYFDGIKEPQEAVRYEMAAGRFGVAKPKSDVRTPVLRSICPSLLNCAESDLIDRSPEL